MFTIPLNETQIIFCVALNGTVDAMSGKTFKSHEINRPFKLLLVRPHFALNQNRTVKLYPYLAFDASEPTSLPLTGTNLLDSYSDTPYIAGDGEYKEIPCMVDVPQGGAYLKIFADNTDIDQHSIDVQLIGLFTTNGE
jgi:hypothetical protein